MINSDIWKQEYGWHKRTLAPEGSGFDLKYSFGRATIDLQLDVNSFKFNPTYFYDRYDFDPKAWGVRSIKNELITRGYSLYSRGKAFNIIYYAK